jgi:hypothetical protein
MTFVEYQREAVRRMRETAALDTRNRDGSPWSFRKTLTAKAEELGRWLAPFEGPIE